MHCMQHDLCSRGIPHGQQRMGACYAGDAGRGIASNEDINLVLETQSVRWSIASQSNHACIGWAPISTEDWGHDSLFESVKYAGMAACLLARKLARVSLQITIVKSTLATVPAQPFMQSSFESF